MEAKLNIRKFALIILACICCVFAVLVCSAAPENSLWHRLQSPTNKGRLSELADKDNNDNTGTDSCPVAVGEVVQNVRTNYLSLFRRYLDWSNKYKRLHGPGSRPGDAMKREFARIDARLFEEETEKASELQKRVADGKEVDLYLIETPDYLFKTLTVLVEQLESKLASGEDFEEEKEEEEDQAIATLNEELAFKRVKRIALKSFGRFVAGELVSISRIALFYRLANVILVPESPLFFMAPFIELVVSVQTPILKAYMQNVQLRAVFKLIDSCDPVTNVVEWFKARARPKKQD